MTNGFDDDTWAAILHDPRIAGEGAYTGDDGPLPWQHEITDVVGAAPPTLDALAISVIEIYAPWTLPGWVELVPNVPADFIPFG